LLQIKRFSIAGTTMAALLERHYEGTAMAQRARLKEFMLIARATGNAGRFPDRIQQALRLAFVTFPAVSWKAEFALGPREHVEIFGAGSDDEARLVSQYFARAPGVRAEVLPLAMPWER
jgi:hypothetical protein